MLWAGSKSLASCMQGPYGSTPAMQIPPKGSEFAAWVIAGNPWAPEHMARSSSTISAATPATSKASARAHQGSQQVSASMLG